MFFSEKPFFSFFIFAVQITPEEEKGPFFLIKVESKNYAINQS
jgi:hypothetical protein